MVVVDIKKARKKYRRNGGHHRTPSMWGSGAEGIRLVKIAAFPFIRSKDSLEVALLTHSLSSRQVCLSPVPTAKGMVTIAVAVLQASWAGTCLIELHSHQKRHPKVFCEICEKSFKTSQQLKRHKWMHTGEKPFQCKICQKSFNQTGVLSRHVATHRAHSCDKGCQPPPNPHFF